MLLTVLFDDRKRSTKAMGNCHYVQNSAHEFRTVAVARDAIGKQSRVNVDAIQEGDGGDLKGQRINHLV